MDTYNTLTISRQGAVITVQLNREAALNALNAELMDDLTRFARAHEYDTETRAIILRGADRFFSAGADLSQYRPVDPHDPPDLMARRREAMRGPEMCNAWEDMQPVTIAAIEGHCIGGGAALVLGCDFRILGRSAYLRLPEVPLGINMSWHAVPRLTALIGPSRAKRVIMFGKNAAADDLLLWGAADELVADGEAYAAAQAMASALCELPPLPVAMTKKAVNAAAHATSYAATFMDSDQYLVTALSQDFAEGVTAFRERRKPKFRGR